MVIKKVGTYITDNTGKITVNNLEAGNYTWVEVEAIDHYNKVDKNMTLIFIKMDN